MSPQLVCGVMRGRNVTSVGVRCDEGEACHLSWCAV